MKLLFTLTALLMMQLTLSQNIITTQEQEKRIRDVFTPEKIIDISKGISNEIRQRDTIVSLQSKVKALKENIAQLKKEHLSTLTEIAKQNNIGREASDEVNDISDNQLKKERLKWSGLHLYLGAELPKIKINKTIFNTELMYELEKIEFGLKGDLIPSVIENDPKYDFSLSLKARYKFF